MTDPSARPRILLVDDEPLVVETYACSLSDAGLDVEIAASGLEALAIMAERRFDAILSDISMPGLDGVELLRALRQGDLDTPVVLMTGNPGLGTAVRAVELGALRYLLKPVPEATLRESMEQAVSLGRLGRLRREALRLVGEERAGDRAGMEAVFERGLSALYMVYQPIVRACDLSLFAHEALLRTREPSIPHPGSFFETAERLGRVLDLGHAIRRAVGSLLDRNAAPADVFVNLHPQEVVDPALAREDAPLSRHARRVVLEITERAAIEEISGLAPSIARLRERGFRIAIDDLGAGYAGLSAFATLEPEVVKLDMSLVRGVDASPVKRRLISSMTAACKDLGTLVVAEGIETERERDALLGLGVDLFQGYFFGRPGELAAAGS